MSVEIKLGDVRTTLQTIESRSVQCCVTSPPYWGLRDYGHANQIGLEATPEQYVAEMVAIFREVRRVLTDDGVLWLNVGDSYNGSGGNHKPHHKNDTGFQGQIGAEKYRGQGRNIKELKMKDLVGIPWRLAFALQDDGWYFRQDIIWHKPNPMPESVRDRCTKSHEYMFMLTKSARYFYDSDAIKEPAVTGAWDKMPPIGVVKQTNGNGNNTYSGNQPPSNGTRNKRSVWSIPTRPFKGAHFAVMPEALVEPCVLATSRPDDIVLDPFNGSGTVGIVAAKHGRSYIGCELNPEYVEITRKRFTDTFGMFTEVKIGR